MKRSKITQAINSELSVLLNARSNHSLLYKVDHNMEIIAHLLESMDHCIGSVLCLQMYKPVVSLVFKS